MCMYVSEICAEGIFVTFPWWLQNVKSWSKIALFSNERHFEIWFPKKRTITFFLSKLSKLHEKDPILHVATTFSLKQGETRTSHRLIPHPLTLPYWLISILCSMSSSIQSTTNWLRNWSTFVNCESKFPKHIEQLLNIFVVSIFTKFCIEMIILPNFCGMLLIKLELCPHPHIPHPPPPPMLSSLFFILSLVQQILAIK